MHKDIYKIYPDTDGVSLSLSHTRIGLPQGFNLDFPTRIPVTFMQEFPREIFLKALTFLHKSAIRPQEVG